jgi:putative ABC transport system permease protein
MFLNHLKTALRTLLRSRIYSFINICGLAIGIATCIILILWTTDELGYDRFHEKAESIYKVIPNFDNSGRRVTWTVTPAPLAPFAKAGIPAITEAVRIKNEGIWVRNPNGQDTRIGVPAAYIDRSFFRVFDFDMIRWNPDNPFPDNKSIIISESLAEKAFGKEVAFGKALVVGDKDEFIVSGIMRDMPQNSSMRFDALLPFSILISNFEADDYWKTLETDWGDYNFSTYLLLHENSRPDEVSGQLTAIHRQNQKESNVSYTLQPLTKLHLYGPDLSEKGIQVVRIFVIVAILILLIACINYINLATARAAERAREIGVRKTVGANRSKLVMQFLIESGAITFSALLVALMMIELIMPAFNMLAAKQLEFRLLDKENMVIIASVLCSAWLIAGLYPALLLSSFNPIKAIRGKLLVSGSSSFFRKTLVIIQFALSIGIIAATLLISKQMHFIRSKNLGFDKENVFTFWMSTEMQSHIQAVRTELEKQPGIDVVTAANQAIWQVGNTTGDTDWEGKTPSTVFMIHPINVLANFKDALGLELVEGRWFSEDRADTASFILNETAVKAAGIENPVGKSFTLWQTKGTIIGVVKDFHHASMHEKIEPSVFIHAPDWYNLAYVKLNGRDTEGAIKATEKVWKQYSPKLPFAYTFMDADYDAMYRSELRTGKVFTGFSIVAVVISCLGLFGLATFTASQRTKEIGVRKVLGATVSQIVMLLSKDFLRLVVIAFIISVPIAWFATQLWLQGFAYKVSMDWTVFALAGGLALIIAFITVSFQTVTAGTSNPVDALRNE